MGNLDDFSIKVHGLKSQLSGPLAIGIVNNMISDRRSPVAKAVGSLLEVAPMVKINLEVCPPSELLRDLTVRKFDVVIVVFQGVQRDSSISICMMKATICIAAHLTRCFMLKRT